MKQIYATLTALMLTIAAGAQTLNIKVGDVIYRFPSSQAGDMTYADGTNLTIMGKTFALTDVTSMYVDDTQVSDNLVSVEYDGSSATVYVAGNVAQYVAPTVSGAHVTIDQSNTDAVDDDEITYQLSGSTTDGSLTLSGSYKCTVSLAGVTMTSTTGAAINITNSKRIQISAKKGTVNTLADCANGSQKACLYSKGQIQLQGNGTLNVTGNTKHAIKSASYISIKNMTLNITSSVADGINCEEYFQMTSGDVTVSGVGDDGIQCDLGGTSSTGATTSHEDEDSGNIYIEGGTLNVTATATAAKCINSEGDINITDGTITLNAKGDIDLTDTTDPSYTAGFKAEGNIVMAGGTSTITVTGAAGRGVGAGQTFTSTNGTLTVNNSGATKSSGTSYFCTAKGIKATTIDIQGGNITVTTSGAASKGILADNGNLTISGGTVNVTTSGTGAYDGTDRDAKGCAGLKSDGNMTISGGTITLKSTGTGGKCIKADGTLTVSDGTLSATSTGSKYSYSSSLTASAKAIKSTGAMTVNGGDIYASSSSHEAIETKNTLTVNNGYIYAYSTDDAINSASHMTINGGYVMANSSGNDGLDANGNLYIKGGNIVAVASRSPEVGIDANTEGGYKLYITGGNIVAIGGLESGSSISNGTAYQASSYTKGSWYALYNASNSVAFAFKVPSNSSMGTSMVVYTTGTTSLKSGVTGSGTGFWNGWGYTNASGGSSVTLSEYTNSGGGPGGGGGGGGGWRPGW